MELLGLIFHPGVGVQVVISERFGLPVTSSGVSSSVFFLVASFGRYKFRLCPLSVGLLLQATIGGVARDFSVLQLGPRVFCFSVSSKVVGFHIFKLVSFECSCYKVFFHLWGNGGPRWDLELAAFNREEADSWVPVKGSIQRLNHKSFADAVKSGILMGANSLPIRQSVFKRIVFPDNAWGSHAVHPE